MGFELRPSSTANSHFRKTKVSGDGIIGGGVRAGPFLCLLRADRKSKPGIRRYHRARPRNGKLYRIIAKTANSVHPVLILGESGTGKEIVARSIHHYVKFAVTGIERLVREVRSALDRCKRGASGRREPDAQRNARDSDREASCLQTRNVDP